SVEVVEGLQTNFGIRLASAPESDVTVNIEKLAGDVDISAHTTDLLFTAENWMTYQYIMITADADADAVNGTATFELSSFGLDTISVQVTERDITIANLPPVPLAATIRVSSGYSGTSQIIANDPNMGDTHNYSVTSVPISGSAQVDASGVVTYTPEVGFGGNDSMTITVTDQGGLNGAVTINVIEAIGRQWLKEKLNNGRNML
ncbi:hypothetical protein LCGC14_2995470, partial [marine sediment metagenome]